MVAGLLGRRVRSRRRVLSLREPWVRANTNALNYYPGAVEAEKVFVAKKGCWT
jgi:hypothetical protein